MTPSEMKSKETICSTRIGCMHHFVLY